MAVSPSIRPEGPRRDGPKEEVVDRVVITQVLRRARAATAAFAGPPPVSLDRVAGRLGIAEIRRVELVGGGAGARLEEADGRRVLAVDRRIPPRTPQWNGLVALTPPA